VKIRYPSVAPVEMVSIAGSDIWKKKIEASPVSQPREENLEAKRFGSAATLW